MISAIDHEAVRQKLSRHVPDRVEQIMRCLALPYTEKGGARGESKLLIRLLKKRFGVVPPLLRESVFAASFEQIEALADRIFDASDIHAVFGTSEHERMTPVDLGVFHDAMLRHIPDRADRALLFLVLNRILRYRFGEVPLLLHQRILAANLGQIKAWLERACDAPDIHSVFDIN
jgi:hypothetical protein